ncbi:nucleotide sugar dehydrogenase [Methanospirillum stamsii]|uniref:UDP-N-acetyl-D-mannosamine dehydrogenase n=1 Tax=Methanospirillum stamsii TaxID=1277351 RepID=A0A2V2N554_9EURY|nr:nucleotide sugar dehydrogenase [Methanospirillum stamsii]PWR73645.1 nucleotide sugar dehydrogenase [Methanospirillum stamsii]
MATDLSDLIRERGHIRKIGVIGMGYVGIPSAVLFAKVPGIEKVYGFQRNSSSSGYKIRMLNEGTNPLKGEEPGLDDLLADVVSQKIFECTDDFSKISECDAITIAIQTPFKDPRDLIPDLSALEDGIRQTGKNLIPGMLVVLESTITPGTTVGRAREILEESGLIAGQDFALAHAPERVMVGRLIQNIQEHDRVVGGIDEISTKRAIELYQPILTKGKIIPMSATAAEVTKTAENTFRDLQIAAANQLALYCEAMGVNFYDVRSGIDSLKGDGITRAILWPGAGVGGHCLTKDTYHLERGIELAGISTLDFPKDHESLFTLARHVNDFMPCHMLHLVSQGLKCVGKKVSGSRIAILGFSFLPNTDDARNTPTEQFYKMCVEHGAVARIHDPWVREYPGISLSSDIEPVLEDADVLVLMTAHRMYYSLDYNWVKKVMRPFPVLVDGRNIVDPDVLIQAGFVYEGIGRGDKNSYQSDV